MGTCLSKNRPNRRCYSCHEPKPTEVKYTNLGDGRYLCPDCLSISLFEPGELELIIRQVLYSFFDDHLKLPVRKDIPIFFVDANEINRDLHEISVVGATLAYQMVREWIRLQGWTSTLETSVEESICGVVASMWLDYTTDENDPSYTENNARFALSRYRRGLLETGGADGAEFLKAKRAVEKYGLEGTLMQVAQTGSIPE